MKADKILVNGTIYTGVSQRPYSHLALATNRILALGRGSGRQYIGRNTEVIDLRGMCVTPGLIDSHLHFLDYALSLHRMDLRPCNSLREVIAALKERAGRSILGEWILGRGWNKKQFGGFPHKKLLDEILPDNPAALTSQDEHFLWVNSKALQAAGLSEPVSVSGGYIGTDPDGSLNGIFGENAIPLIRKNISAPDPLMRKNAILSTQKKLHEMGIIGFDGLDANQSFGDLQQLHSESLLKLRVFHSIPLRQLEDAVRLSLRSGLGDDWFQFGFVKIFSDGTLGSLTASMLEPYNETGGTGMDTISENELTEKIDLALRNGISVAVHAIGDRANRRVLNAFERNAALLRIPRARSRIEHAQLIHPDDIPRFQRIGVVASMQPYHAISDREMAERYWGDRAKYAYPWHSLLKSGALLAFGSDAPADVADPLQGLSAAVHRNNWNDRGQVISVHQALQAYTWNPAVVRGTQANQGSLEPGKLADFVVFSEDPYKTAFLGIRVVATAVNGEIVYRDFES